MRKIPLAMMLLVVPAGLCQAPNEPSTLQSLLVEVHQLRQDIESMTVASQRVQIALYTLQMQDAAVTRAAVRVDEAGKKCSGAEENRAHFASEVQRLETSLASGTRDEGETRAMQEALAHGKQEIEVRSAEVRSCQAAESQVQGDFRNEQAKLTDLQDRIGRLDQALAKLGVDGK